MADQQWNDLLYALSKGKCIVLLGAGASTYEAVGGQAIPLTEGLSLHLAGMLAEKGHPLEPDEERSLLYVATEFQQQFSQGRLHEQTELFYKKNGRQPSEVLRLLAELPVPLFINTAPDMGLGRAFRARFRDFSPAFYTLKKEKRSTATLPEASPEMPVIYNLFGSTEDIDSLVLTEPDRLRFVEDVIQNNGSIPNAILKEMTADKVLLFLGFDFEQWHLRILPRSLLKADELAAPILVPNGQQALARGTSIFFKKQYKMDFLSEEPTEFARQLVERWRDLEQKNGPADGGATGSGPLEVCFLYDQADEFYKNELDKHLATLRRNDSIRTWDESKLEPGAIADEAIRERLGRANLILLLVSSDFLANDKIYEQQLRLALERVGDGRTLICPILVRPCAWEGAVFAKMPVILPKNKKAVAAWADRDEAWREVAQKLEGCIDSLLENIKGSYP